ncbi:PREDICTED: interferon lambda receptor 1 [Elephantulus edwardii]|uniref:interferon lambda receptor 1 n=1 Tax=Elephantulus edwardii TaxID=28737 RepID=UPI0003F0EC0F|nr:PREDICTED: interferon lambda receptor 1 [Elephantulus edwardii]
MAGTGQWASLLLCLLQSAPGQGRSRLAPPQNVTLFSQNFDVYLMWLPGPGNPQNVTYLVAYQSSSNPMHWQKVKKCAGTTELVCSLICVKNQDLFNKFKGRVRAVSSSVRSPWVESKSLDYLSEVVPAPPTLVFKHKEEMLSVNATYQLPQCMPLIDLKYEVCFWKEGTRNKTTCAGIPYGQPVQIPLQPATGGQHCLSARTIYTFTSPRYSEFSKTSCFFLEAPVLHWPFLVLLPLALLVLIAMGSVIRKRPHRDSWFQQAKMPRALDFSGYTHPVPTCQPSIPEVPNALILCPQTELTPSTWLAPRVRTLQVGPEDNAESGEEEPEEDDTDDNVSVQPYIEPPSFLGQGLQHPQCSETDGVHSRGPQALVQVKGSSTWDSSGRSWASNVDSPSCDEAAISDYVTKTGPNEGLKEDGRWEPVPTPELPDNLASLKEIPREDLSPWATWGSSSGGPSLVPEEPPVSPWKLTFCWDSSAEEEEVEEEEDGEESECEDSDSGHWGAESSLRTEGVSACLGHYMARDATETYKPMYNIEVLEGSQGTTEAPM